MQCIRIPGAPLRSSCKRQSVSKGRLATLCGKCCITYALRLHCAELHQHTRSRVGAPAHLHGPPARAATDRAKVSG